jgi:hypothetical protein
MKSVALRMLGGIGLMYVATSLPARQRVSGRRQAVGRAGTHGLRGLGTQPRRRRATRSASETDTNFKVAEVSAKRLADECPVRGAGDDLRGHFEDWDGRPI